MCGPTSCQQGWGQSRDLSALRDEGWVCESHPDQPFAGPHACRCGGAGIPCPSADFSAYAGVLAVAWIGAQVSSSGIGSWVAGPEAGQQFSSLQTPLNGMYTNWGGIEPNNAPSAVDMQIGTLNWFGIVQGKFVPTRVMGFQVRVPASAIRSSANLWNTKHRC
jgi:hypothetical protein